MSSEKLSYEKLSSKKMLSKKMGQRTTVTMLGLLILILTAAGCTGTSTPDTEVPEQAVMQEEQAEAMSSDETSSETPSAEKVDEEMMDESEDAMTDEGEAMEEDEAMEESEEAMTEPEEAMAEEAEEPMEETTEGEEAEESMTEGEEGDETMTDDDIAVLSLEITGLEDLGPGWSYEGWLIVADEPVSSGSFSVDGDGMASTYDFEVNAEQLAAAELFVLTIEPTPDPDPAPSQVHILAGAFEGDSAGLSIAHPAALGTDFTSAAGSTYILGIPSSGMAEDSYASGIWFDGLNLPTLPAGWVYEGWVVGMDGPITTGRYMSATGADSDGTGPTAGPNPGPAIPGQDFLIPAIFLTDGYAVVISVEPEPDNSPAPFTLKPLVDMSVEDVGDHGAQELTYSSDSFPTGTAHRGRN